MSKPKKPKKVSKSQGRPSKYKPEYCDLVIEYCKQGKSFDSFAASIGVHRDSLNEWVKVYPDFATAKQKARIGAEEFMMTLGMNGMVGKIKGFQAAVWIFWMKARFGWSDAGPTEEIEETELEFI